MIRKYLLPIFALFGLFLALFMVFYGAKKPPTPPILFPPPTPPYKYFIAGSGIIESAVEDINIGTPFSEIITKIYVKIGSEIKEGMPLFQLNTEILVAEYKKATQHREVAYTNYLNESAQFSLYQNLQDKRAVSENDFNQKYYALEVAKKKLDEADATLEVIATKIERSTIRAPFDGEILQLNIRLGESVDTNPFNNKPLILFGKTHPLHIRIEIDEDDAWRFKKGAPAVAYVRGNSSISIPLKFLYIEPYIIPKTALTGDNQEKVDTRVLQIVYELDRKNLPIYAGQLMDVYIKGTPFNEKF